MSREIRKETDVWGNEREVIYENDSTVGEIREEQTFFGLGPTVKREYDNDQEVVSEMRREETFLGLGPTVERTYTPDGDCASETRKEATFFGLGPTIERTYDNDERPIAEARYEKTFFGLGQTIKRIERVGPPPAAAGSCSCGSGTQDFKSIPSTAATEDVSSSISAETRDASRSRLRRFVRLNAYALVLALVALAITETFQVSSESTNASVVPVSFTYTDGSNEISVSAPSLPAEIAGFLASRKLSVPTTIDKHCRFSTDRHPFFIAGDFDGDRRIDYAVDAERSKGYGTNLFVFLANGNIHQSDGWEYIKLNTQKSTVGSIDGPVRLDTDSIVGVHCEKSSALLVFDDRRNQFDKFWTSD